jgi:threonine dehydrogenase-like Zn-dependent dehydrogenase
MKVAVYHGPGQVRLEEQARPEIENPEDVIVEVRVSTLCGTDLHPFRGRQEKPEGYRIGHECVGVIDEAGVGAGGFRPGDRVLIPATLCCGFCRYCSAGLTAQCVSPESGTLQGAQGEVVRVPYAPANLIRIPEAVSDEAALTLTDIFPTGDFAAQLGGVKPGDSVAVFGAGPVGLMAMVSARMRGAVRIYALDHVPDRLEAAAEEGFIPINFMNVDPVCALAERMNGQGVDVSIEAVGQDAVDRQGQLNASQTLEWAAAVTRPCGTIAVVGDFTTPTAGVPLHVLFHRNLALKSGIAHHRTLIPPLLEAVRRGQVDPTFVFDAEFDLAEISALYPRFERQGFLKALIWTKAGRRAQEQRGGRSARVTPPRPAAAKR